MKVNESSVKLINVMQDSCLKIKVSTCIAYRRFVIVAYNKK